MFGDIVVIKNDIVMIVTSIALGSTQEAMKGVASVVVLPVIDEANDFV